MHAISPHRVVLVLALGFTCGVSSVVAASHVTIRPDGSGDFPTINEAVQVMSTAYIADTILVEPGYYDEVVNDGNWFSFIIYGRAGAESTQVRSFVSLPEQPYYAHSYGGKAVGLTILEKVAWGRNSSMLLWEDCIFEKGWDGSDDMGRGPPVRRCTFRGSSSFVGFGFDLTECNFERAPVYIENLIGYIRPYRCTFRGPCDELVRIMPRDESDIYFEECSFSNASDGVVVRPIRYYRQLLDLVHCRFEHLTGNALSYKYGVPETPEPGDLWLILRGNVFSDIGEAVQCASSIVVKLSSTTDTLQNLRGNGIEATVRRGFITGLRARDVGGAGVLLENQDQLANPTPYWENEILLSDCSIERCGGDGISIGQIANPVLDPQRIEVADSKIRYCRGRGAAITGTGPHVTGCLFRANDGDGVSILAVGAAPSCSLSYNSVIGNGGRGLRIESPGAMSNVEITRNLVTGNALDGLALLAPYSGFVSTNDAWENSGLPFLGLGPGESNLELDPLYCMPSAGDFDLRSDSPCAPASVNGLIGARDVGCTVAVAVEDPSPGDPGLRVFPNPSYGTVWFAPTGKARPHDLAIFDLQGREVWAAEGNLDASGPIRWESRSDSGRPLASGIYFVRWHEGSNVRRTRLVLLAR